MKKKYLITGFIIILGILVLSRINLNNNKELAVYIENELNSSIPASNENLYVNKIDCDNNVNAYWDNDTWGLFISNFSKKTKCNLYFIHDTEKPYWQIEEVEKTSVLSTDIFTIKISGNDSLSKVTSSLDTSSLSFYVNDTYESPIKVELTKLEELNKKITYSLKVHMVGGEGNLKLKINSNTLADNETNQNDEITLDTGITVSKNPAKIYYYIRNDYRDLRIINNYYQDAYKESGDNIDLNKILSENYDLVFSYDAVWTTSDTVNTVWQNNINLITAGNDNGSQLDIIKEAVNSTYANESHRLINNAVTYYLPETFGKDTDTSLALIKFRDEATTLYANNTNNTEYGTIGYWQQNGKIWFHIQSDYMGNNILTYTVIPIIQFTLGELK